MQRMDLTNVFLRSFLIQSSLNFRRMQNMGFAFAVMPLMKRKGKTTGEISNFLLRHLQLFNTHPYLAASILGSVVRVEEELGSDENSSMIVQLKKTLMGPYAAIGDTFFWGTLRPFAAVVAVMFSAAGCLWAPIVFLILFEPVHLWVRWQGFIEGYRLGNQGFTYVQSLNLTTMNSKIRWLSVTGLALFMACWLQTVQKPEVIMGLQTMRISLVVLLLIILCYWGVRKHISPVVLFYILATVIFLISI
jgi:mannose PTS system EIID component